MVSEYLIFEKVNEHFVWTVDTTRQNIIGFQRHSQLQKEIQDWNAAKPFFEKYGLILNYPDNYIHIFLLIRLSRFSKLFCHPLEQGHFSLFKKNNFKEVEVSWIYKTCITYDKLYNYKIENEGFEKSGYSEGIKFLTLEKTMTKNPIKKLWNILRLFKEGISSYSPLSSMYELNNCMDVYLAVNNAGNSDVYAIDNYFGVPEQKVNVIIEKLSSRRSPDLSDVLDICDFFILDFKGEDVGYARHFKIYSYNDISHILNKIFKELQVFIIEMRSNFVSSSSIAEFEEKTNSLLRKYEQQ